MRKILIAAFAACAAAACSLASADDEFRRPEAARQVVEDYYKAIDDAHYRAAYQLWGGAGSASGKTYAKFRQGYAQTAHSRVVTGAPVNGDAAMGSVFVDIPVDVYAILKNGRQQHFSGTYTLRRVNDIDGATQEQLHWHITSATLKASR